jgi:hypothetical protein
MASARLYLRAATLLPRSPLRSNEASGTPAGLSSPSNRTKSTVGLTRPGRSRRASWVTTAVPEAPSFAPTKPAMSFVS